MAIKITIDYSQTLADIEKDWEKLFETSFLPYFCSLAWHKVVLAFFAQTNLTKRFNKLTYFEVKIDAETSPSIVGFFYIGKNKGKRFIKFSHLLGPSDYYDFVYRKEIANDIKEEVIRRLILDNKAESVYAAHVKPESFLAESISLLLGSKLVKQEMDCVAISDLTNYEEYLKSLAKNAAQNRRTAYNRLKRDGRTYSFEMLGKSDFSKIDFEQLKTIYTTRSLAKQQTVSWKSKLFTFLDLGFRKKPDMFDFKSLEETDFTLGTLKIDTKIAAYFFGFYSNGRIEINRVAIDMEFKFYSPGIVLFNEYLKLEIQNGLTDVDLTLGDEKYKFDLGGNMHRILNIQGEL